MNPYSDIDFIEQDRNKIRCMLGMFAAMIHALCGNPLPLACELYDTAHLHTARLHKPWSSP